MATKTEDKALQDYRAFIKMHGDEKERFATKELAYEAAKLKMAWWGSNLVFLKIEEREGRYFATYNVWD